MLQILRTVDFDTWLTALRDKVGQKQVLARLTRLSLGHWGDSKPVGSDVVELRIHSGPGYRVYCWKDGLTVVVALVSWCTAWGRQVQPGARYRQGTAHGHTFEGVI